MDEQMRVLDTDGKALDNVYCIGDANGAYRCDCNTDCNAALCGSVQWCLQFPAGTALEMASIALQCELKPAHPLPWCGL